MERHVSRPAAVQFAPQRHDSGRRTRLLWTLLLLEFALLVAFIRRDGFLLTAITSSLRPARTDSRADPRPLFENDPRLGALLPAGPVGDAIRTSVVPSSVGYLVVAVGDCAGCIKADLPGWQKQCRARGVSMVLLTSASESAAADFRRRHGLRVPVVSDPSEAMQRRLNAVWYGRPYLYSPEWRLRWIPTVLGGDSPFADERFLAALKATGR